ncbi:Signal peptide peptidase-like 2 [Ranunculus cassubicifolius]
MKVISIWWILVVVILIYGSLMISASDIVHSDNKIPKKPGCTNKFVLVKVQLWVDGEERDEMVGLGAQFGATLVAKKKNASRSKLVLSDPFELCSQPKNQISGDVALVKRGHCEFTTKAKLAQDAGASAVLIVNTKKELFKMGCGKDDMALQISIHTVMLPQDAGQILEKALRDNSSVELQLYSPERPLIDVAELLLWFLAVGTIIGASYWSAWSAREASIELDKILKDAPDDYVNTDDTSSSGVVDISALAAVVFVVCASCFLLFLYKFMSNFVIICLVILFCMGGIEGLQTCLVAVLYRWFKNAGDSFIQIPYLGAISHLTLGVSPFCAAFAVVWAVNRDSSFAWIGQDILGITLIVTILQIVRVPNLKVGCILLGCAFLYDVFWVFTSKEIFNQSVMIVVAHGGKSKADGIPMLLKIPRINDPWHGYSVVGFGDIILPGLVIAFSLRYDWLSNKSFRAGYFVWAMTAYGLGLLLTYVALTFMDEHGQPALLYISPLTLGSLLILGKMRGELEILWDRGEPYRACPHMHLHTEQMCGNEGCECTKSE